jgi:hypothetical protein
MERCHQNIVAKGNHTLAPGIQHRVKLYVMYTYHRYTQYHISDSNIHNNSTVQAKYEAATRNTTQTPTARAGQEESQSGI